MTSRTTGKLLGAGMLLAYFGVHVHGDGAQTLLALVLAPLLAWLYDPGWIDAVKLRRTPGLRDVALPVLTFILAAMLLEALVDVAGSLKPASGWGEIELRKAQVAQVRLLLGGVVVLPVMAPYLANVLRRRAGEALPLPLWPLLAGIVATLLLLVALSGLWDAVAEPALTGSWYKVRALFLAIGPLAFALTIAGAAATALWRATIDGTALRPQLGGLYRAAIVGGIVGTGIGVAIAATMLALAFSDAAIARAAGEGGVLVPVLGGAWAYVLWRAQAMTPRDAFRGALGIGFVALAGWFFTQLGAAMIGENTWAGLLTFLTLPMGLAGAVFAVVVMPYAIARVIGEDARRWTFAARTARAAA